MPSISLIAMIQTYLASTTVKPIIHGYYILIYYSLNLANATKNHDIYVYLL